MPTILHKVEKVHLKHYLDQFLETFPKEHHVAMDPVQFVHRYPDSADREVIGFVAAAFSYGNVKSVLGTLENIVSRMGNHPARFVAAFDPGPNARVFDTQNHRHRRSREIDVIPVFTQFSHALFRHQLGAVSERQGNSLWTRITMLSVGSGLNS